MLVEVGAENSRSRYWRVSAYPAVVTVLETNGSRGAAFYCLTCLAAWCSHITAVRQHIEAPPDALPQGATPTPEVHDDGT